MGNTISNIAGGRLAPSGVSRVAGSDQLGLPSPPIQDHPDPPPQTTHVYSPPGFVSSLTTLHSSRGVVDPRLPHSNKQMPVLRLLKLCVDGGLNYALQLQTQCLSRPVASLEAQFEKRMGDHLWKQESIKAIKGIESILLKLVDVFTQNFLEGVLKTARRNWSRGQGAEYLCSLLEFLLHKVGEGDDQTVLVLDDVEVSRWRPVTVHLKQLVDDSGPYAFHSIEQIVIPQSQLNASAIETIVRKRAFFGANSTNHLVFFIKRKHSQPHTPQGLGWEQLEQKHLLDVTDSITLHVVAREAPFLLTVVGRLPWQKDVTLVIDASPTTAIPNIRRALRDYRTRSIFSMLDGRKIEEETWTDLTQNPNPHVFILARY